MTPAVRHRQLTGQRSYTFWLVKLAKLVHSLTWSSSRSSARFCTPPCSLCAPDGCCRSQWKAWWEEKRCYWLHLKRQEDDTSVVWTKRPIQPITVQDPASCSYKRQEHTASKWELSSQRANVHVRHWTHWTGWELWLQQESTMSIWREEEVLLDQQETDERRWTAGDIPPAAWTAWLTAWRDTHTHTCMTAYSNYRCRLCMWRSSTDFFSQWTRKCWSASDRAAICLNRWA